MFLAKRSLSRRTLLRGSGSLIVLPLLDAMLPAQSAATTTPARLVCIEMVHGAAGSTNDGSAKHYWSPAQAGADFEFSYTLEPLKALREYITILSNTDARTAEASAPSEGGADHFRSSAVYLTAAKAKQTEGLDVANGISIDQVYAQKQSSDRRVPSLQLCIENIGLSGSCGFNYNCVYADTISWASETKPLPMVVNPRIVFEQLFGRASGASVLDGLREQRAGMGLGSADALRLDRYLESVRATERQIQAIERRNALAPVRERGEAPLGVPDSWEEHVKLMFDLQALALEGDVTRVSAFKMSRDVNNRIFKESGVTHPFHTLSHHIEVPSIIAEFAKLNRYHVGVVGHFLNRLKNTPDGDGNLLDHSLVMYGSPMGDSNTHDHRRLPIFLAGRANGRCAGTCIMYVSQERRMGIRC
ncbi:MAG: DUF1552 domain-containing protein [Acidobacteriota bacterium]